MERAECNRRMFLGQRRRVEIDQVAWWTEESENRRMLLGEGKRVRII